MIFRFLMMVCIFSLAVFGQPEFMRRGADMIQVSKNVLYISENIMNFQLQNLQKVLFCENFLKIIFVCFF